MKPSISLIVLTHDEEKNLPQCLKSVEGLVDEIFVVDSYSIDGTKEVAKRFGAHFVQHEFINQAQQFNWALENLDIKGEWILRLDADEVILSELKHEIMNRLGDLPKDINGVVLRRRVYFMGKWIRHGGYYPTCLLRMFRKGKGVSEVREMDEHLILKEGEEITFKNDFIDDNKKGLHFWIEKHNGYATREAEEILRAENKKQESSRLGGQAGRKRWLKEKIYNNSPLFIRPLFYYLYRYFFLLGFLDGKEGLIFHFLQAFWYRFLVDVKVYEMRKYEKS